MATLAADGLVEARQGAGVFVTDRPSLAFGSISLDVGRKISQALNVLEVRIGIEIESAALAALRRSAAQEAAIHEAFFEFERLLAAGEATGKADFGFHRAIAVATGNPFYVEVLDALGSRTIPCDVTSPFATDAALSRRLSARPAARAPGDPRGDRRRRRRRRPRRHARPPVGQPAALSGAALRAAGRSGAGMAVLPRIRTLP